MYLLMNKDRIVASFDKKPASEFQAGTSFEMKEIFGNLPYGFSNINTWLDGRKASKHNERLKEIMNMLGCNDNEGFIQVTHAATINDTFWVKSDSERVSWEQVSLYQNQFTEVISRLAFEGYGLHDAVVSSTSPELSCEGSFPKCFRKENEVGEWGSDIFIYKRGHSKGINSGLEPYCERLASEIAQIVSNHDAVSYETVQLHGKLASRCNLFTNEEYGYASFARLADVRSMDFEDIFRFFAEHGAEQAFREMLVIDSLCFNTDRHAGNYGMMFNNDTLELYAMSPVFDLNLSLLPYVMMDEFQNVGDKLYGYSPALGNDFTRIGQIGLNDVLRDRVKDMRDFSFSFRGDDTFSPERVRILEGIVRQQADAILSHDKLFTKDVFFSEQAKLREVQKEKATTAIALVNAFADRLERSGLEDDVFVSVCSSTNDVQCIVEDSSASYSVTADFLKGTLTIEHNQHSISPQELQDKNDSFYKTYKNVRSKLKMFMRERQDERFTAFFKEQLQSDMTVTKNKE